MPGMMKPKSKMKYQEGGPVRMPGKRRVLEGGEKGVPVMTPEQRRQAREARQQDDGHQKVTASAFLCLGLLLCHWFSCRRSRRLPFPLGL